MQLSLVYHIHAGVHLSLNNTLFLPNNSAVFISDIRPANSLQCVTDRMPCCSTPPNKAGEWYFPDDGGMVPALESDALTFYTSRGDDGTVNLNRVSNDVMMPTGQFCCVVLDATGVTQWACAIICEFY